MIHVEHAQQAIIKDKYQTSNAEKLLHNPKKRTGHTSDTHSTFSAFLQRTCSSLTESCLKSYEDVSNKPLPSICVRWASRNLHFPPSHQFAITACSPWATRSAINTGTGRTHKKDIHEAQNSMQLLLIPLERTNHGKRKRLVRIGLVSEDSS